MKNLYIIGGGGFCTEVLHVVERINNLDKKWNEIYIIDDNIKIGIKIRDHEVVGNIDHLCSISENIEVVITINDTEVRKQIIDRILLNNKNINFPNIIDESAILDHKYLDIGKGNILMHFVILSTNVKLGNFNILNSYTGIGHDSTLQDFNTLNPRVAISGNVNIKDLNNFGLNSAVLQNKKIGSKNEIWMNSVIVKNLKDDGKYFGIPAKNIDL